MKTTEQDFEEQKLFYTAGYKFRVEKEFRVHLLNSPILDQRIIKMGKDVIIPFARIKKVDHGKYVLILEKDYSWDGATWALDSKNFRIGSACHDALLEMIGLQKIPAHPWKKYADQFLIKLCKDAGMWAPRRSWVHRAVRLLGDPHGSKPRKVYSVP